MIPTPPGRFHLRLPPCLLLLTSAPDSAAGRNEPARYRVKAAIDGTDRNCHGGMFD